MLLGDDVAILDLATAAARPAPRRVSLRSASRELLGEALFARIQTGPSSVARPDSWLFHPDEVEPRRRPDSVRLTAILFLTRQGGSSAGAYPRPLVPAHALLALVPYTNLRAGIPLGEAIRTLAPLAERVPTFDLGRGPLAEMAAAVEGLAGTASLT
jgi:hypothetical protein